MLRGPARSRCACDDAARREVDRDDVRLEVGRHERERRAARTARPGCRCDGECERQRPGTSGGPIPPIYVVTIVRGPAYPEQMRRALLTLAVCGAALTVAGPAAAGNWLPHPAGATWTYQWVDSVYTPEITTEKVWVSKTAGDSFTLGWTSSDTSLANPVGAVVGDGTMSFQDTETGLAQHAVDRHAAAVELPDPLRQPEQLRQQPREHALQRDLGHQHADASRAGAHRHDVDEPRRLAQRRDEHEPRRRARDGDRPRVQGQAARGQGRFGDHREGRSTGSAAARARCGGSGGSGRC